MGNGAAFKQEFPAEFRNATGVRELVNEYVACAPSLREAVALSRQQARSKSQQGAWGPKSARTHDKQQRKKKKKKKKKRNPSEPPKSVEERVNEGLKKRFQRSRGMDVPDTPPITGAKSRRQRDLDALLDQLADEEEEECVDEQWAEQADYASGQTPLTGRVPARASIPAPADPVHVASDDEEDHENVLRSSTAHNSSVRAGGVALASALHSPLQAAPSTTAAKRVRSSARRAARAGNKENVQRAAVHNEEELAAPVRKPAVVAPVVVVTVPQDKPLQWEAGRGDQRGHRDSGRYHSRSMSGSTFGDRSPSGSEALHSRHGSYSDWQSDASSAYFDHDDRRDSRQRVPSPRRSSHYDRRAPPLSPRSGDDSGLSPLSPRGNHSRVRSRSQAPYRNDPRDHDSARRRSRSSTARARGHHRNPSTSSVASYGDFSDAPRRGRSRNVRPAHSSSQQHSQGYPQHPQAYAGNGMPLMAPTPPPPPPVTYHTPHPYGYGVGYTTHQFASPAYLQPVSHGSSVTVTPPGAHAAVPSPPAQQTPSTAAAPVSPKAANGPRVSAISTASAVTAATDNSDDEHDAELTSGSEDSDVYTPEEVDPEDVADVASWDEKTYKEKQEELKVWLAEADRLKERKEAFLEQRGDDAPELDWELAGVTSEEQVARRKAEAIQFLCMMYRNRQRHELFREPMPTKLVVPLSPSQPGYRAARRRRERKAREKLEKEERRARAKEAMAAKRKRRAEQEAKRRKEEEENRKRKEQAEQQKQLLAQQQQQQQQHMQAAAHVVHTSPGVAYAPMMSMGSPFVTVSPPPMVAAPAAYPHPYYPGMAHTAPQPPRHTARTDQSRERARIPSPRHGHHRSRSMSRSPPASPRRSSSYRDRDRDREHDRDHRYHNDHRDHSYAPRGGSRRVPMSPRSPLSPRARSPRGDRHHTYEQQQRGSRDHQSQRRYDDRPVSPRARSPLSPRAAPDMSRRGSAVSTHAPGHKVHDPKHRGAMQYYESQRRPRHARAPSALSPRRDYGILQDIGGDSPEQQDRAVGHAPPSGRSDERSSTEALNSYFVSPVSPSPRPSGSSQPKHRASVSSAVSADDRLRSPSPSPVSTGAQRGQHKRARSAARSSLTEEVVEEEQQQEEEEEEEEENKDEEDDEAVGGSSSGGPADHEPEVPASPPSSDSSDSNEERGQADTAASAESHSQQAQQAEQRRHSDKQAPQQAQEPKAEQSGGIFASVPRRASHQSTRRDAGTRDAHRKHSTADMQTRDAYAKGDPLHAGVHVQRDVAFDNVSSGSWSDGVYNDLAAHERDAALFGQSTDSPRATLFSDLDGVAATHSSGQQEHVASDDVRSVSTTGSSRARQYHLAYLGADISGQQAARVRQEIAQQLAMPEEEPDNVDQFRAEAAAALQTVSAAAFFPEEPRRRKKKKKRKAKETHRTASPAPASSAGPAQTAANSTPDTVRPAVLVGIALLLVLVLVLFFLWLVLPRSCTANPLDVYVPSEMLTPEDALTRWYKTKWLGCPPPYALA